MRPAEREPDLAGRPVLEQALEAAVAVHLQDAPEPGQVGGRVLAPAVLGVEVDHRRRGAPAPGPVVDPVAPQPPGCCEEAAFSRRSPRSVLRSVRSPPASAAVSVRPSAFRRANHLRRRKRRHSLRVWPDYEAIVATCCEAWNWLVAAPDRLASITRREWARAVIN